MDVGFWLGDGMTMIDILSWMSYCVPPFIFAYILHLKKEGVGNMIFNKFNVKKKFTDAQKSFKDAANILKNKEPTQSQSVKTAEQANQQSSSLGTVAAAAATAASASSKNATNQANQDFSQNLSSAKDSIVDKLKGEKDNGNNDESDTDSDEEDDGLLSSFFDDE